MSVPVPDQGPRPVSNRGTTIVLLACIIPMVIGAVVTATGHFLAGYIIGTSGALTIVVTTTIKIRHLRTAHKHTLRHFDEWTANQKREPKPWT